MNLQRLTRFAVVVTGSPACARDSVGAERDYRGRERHVGRGLTWCDGRSHEPCPDRKSQVAVTDGRRLSDCRFAAGHLHCHLHAARFQHVASGKASTLPAEFTATVNAELAVGALEETITVSGEAPVVDIRSSRAQTAIRGETLRVASGHRASRHASRIIPGVTLRRETRPRRRRPSDRRQTAYQCPRRAGGAAGCRRA